MLRRRCGPQFDEQHGEDLFAHAAYDYSRTIAKGKTVDNPAAWLIVGAWNRAKNLLESNASKPPLVSTESIEDPEADAAWQPEEIFLDVDRLRKIHEAVAELPEHQRRLLALSYFEGESIRDAGRRLRWTPSKAQRAHESARKKLFQLLGEPGSSEAIEFEVGLAAFLSLTVAGRTAVAATPSGLEVVAGRIGQALIDAPRRVVSFIRHPFGHARTGSSPQVDVAAGPGRASELGRRIIGSGAAETVAAAGDSPGRMAELCKVAVGVCLVGGTVTAGVFGVGAAQHHHAPGPALHPTTARAGRPNRGTAPPPMTSSGPRAASTASSSLPAGPRRRGQTGEGGQASKKAKATVADSKPATGTHGTETHEEESGAAEEQFGAFSRAAEAESSSPTTSGSSVAQSNTGGGSESSSSSTQTSEPTTTPKESAEAKAANTQFGKALR
jgi:RNA polymerase sigma factor (sigma-70 family)